MAKETAYLQKIGNQYRVTVKVPRNLLTVFGKAHLRVPLHTDSLSKANALKHGVVHRLKAQIAEATAKEREAGPKGVDATPLREAMAWREDMQIAREAGRHDPGQWDLMTDRLADKAEKIEEREGYAKARAFFDIAMGTATPIASLVDQWIAERPMKPRQQTDYRRAVAKFVAWLIEGHNPESIEKVTRRLAGQYVSERFVQQGVNPRTANKDISCVASLWKWAGRKGYVEENVWTGQSLAKPQLTKAEEPREFTDEEAANLLTGMMVTSETRKQRFVGPTPLLRDFMAIAALSGMRVEEIARLTVADTQGSAFNITQAKTKAGIRRVPIHPSLTEIVARRTTGKKPEDTLWPELPEPKPGSASERSQKVVKRFVTYRRTLGVDDIQEGTRQSRVTFHSWRRTFVTKAEQAGNQPHIIEVLVGHKRPGMTLGKYSEGPLLDQLRLVVESVKLSPLTDSLE